MGRQEGRFIKCLYKRYTGRVVIGVGYSQGMEEVFPIVIEDNQGIHGPVYECNIGPSKLFLV